MATKSLYYFNPTQKLNGKPRLYSAFARSRQMLRKVFGGAPGTIEQMEFDEADDLDLFKQAETLLRSKSVDVVYVTPSGLQPDALSELRRMNVKPICYPDKDLLHVFHEGDDDVGAPAESATVRMKLPKDAILLDHIRDAIRTAFSNIWDFEPHVMTDEEYQASQQEGDWYEAETGKRPTELNGVPVPPRAKSTYKPSMPRRKKR